MKTAGRGWRGGWGVGTKGLGGLGLGGGPGGGPRALGPNVGPGALKYGLGRPKGRS